MAAMTSTTTSTRVHGTSRFAAAGLLALAMMLTGCSTSVDVQQFIADAQSQAEAIEEDIQSLEEQVTGVPAELQGQVTDAVASAQAATDEARTALEQAATAEDGAVVALEDAQVALEAASAEVKHVTEQARQDGADQVADLLAQIQEQIDALRGETESAAG
jgi:DNA repair exonuclease SbcCD ATPase subunit